MSVWHTMKLPIIQPIGKLKRVHFMGADYKLWIDERGSVFVIDFKTGSKLYLYSVCR